jgi:pyrroloquinoline quinone biosynthesis protein E
MSSRAYDLKEIKIEITHRCPLTCIHCSSESTPDTIIEISNEKCLELIEQAANLGVKDLAFSGGEPLMSLWIVNAVRFAHEKGLHVSIYTSGNVEHIEDLIEELRACGLEKMVFSVYSDDEVEHEAITRKKGSFSKTLNAIDLAVKSGIQTEIHFVALSNNYKKILAIASLAKACGAKTVSILRFVPQGRGKLLESKVLSKRQSLELKKDIEELRKQGHNIRTGSPLNYLLVNKKPSCNAAIDRMIICPDLRIYPCDAFKQISAEDVAGTLEMSSVETNTLSDCWNYSRYFNAVRSCLNSELLNPCVACKVKSDCLAGCLAQKHIHYGKLINTCDPLCLMK